MEKLVGFQTGVNLGGWLSQYRVYDHRHFKTFITVQDIRRIAGWGMDHIRLPIDYEIFEDDDNPFIYKESGFDYVEQCMDWCQANGLNVVLDLHRAPGYSFDAVAGSNLLFKNPALQNRLVALWEALVKRFDGRNKPGIIFELLNEILLPSSGPWNLLSHRIHKAIRAISQESWIMVGGNEMNSVGTLNEIELFDDPRTVYTFHFYEPLIYTHQKAYWVDELVGFDKELGYPGKIPGLETFLSKNPQCRTRLGRYEGLMMDDQFMRTDLLQAQDFLNQTGRTLYCGEFGVIDTAPKTSRANWYRDYVKILREFDIGYSAWSYKLMNFGLVDTDGHVVDDEIIKTLCGS